MNTEYSKAVLEGALKHGMSELEIARSIRKSRAFVQSVLKEKAALTDRNLISFERAAGTSAGLLALLTLESPDPGLVAVMEAWGATRSWIKAPPKRVKTA